MCAWTDCRRSKMDRCPACQVFCQLPGPWNSLIRKRHHIRVQPPPFSGCSTRVTERPGFRGKASLNDCPGAQPPAGYHSCEGLPSSISLWLPCQGTSKAEWPGKDCPSSSSRRFPAWPPCPAEPLELPGTHSPCSRTMCSSYITSGRNNASLCPAQALELQEQHRRPAAQGTSTLYNHLGSSNISPLASAQGHTSPGVQKPCQAWRGPDE